MPTDEGAPGNDGTAKQTSSEPLPPPDERNDERATSDDSSKENPVEKYQEKPKHWTRYVEAGSAILLVGITLSYTIYAARQASNSTIAIEADRPWVGIHMSVGNLLDGDPAIAKITATNSGRRPAKLMLFTAAGGYYELFPQNPEYRKTSRPPSVGIMVPGDTASAEIPLSSDLVHSVLLNSVKCPTHQFFLYTDVEYVDVVSGKLHFSHACWVYEPKSEMGDPAGFELCNFYNEAQ